MACPLFEVSGSSWLPRKLCGTSLEVLSMNSLGTDHCNNGCHGKHVARVAGTGLRTSVEARGSGDNSTSYL